ncbi:unnamed protein product [Arabis nemorensis]|uniref:RRM domain-containing protein n=1 Tax=Arabis nemorensis TaxID=586526 RepID=A0A565C9W4_9BRAS|nr:unnamed protein product [Arabis nemorensis]
MESNGSDHADNRKSRSKSRSVTMIVSGYDKSLPEDDIKSLLSEHFSSCGDITRVYFAADVETEIRNKHAFFDITGEDAKEKAMQLNGSDMGGRNLVVKVMPASTRFCKMTPQIAVSWFDQSEISRKLPRAEVVMVTGYDTALPEDDIESALTKHFSSCGEISIGKDIDGPGLAETAVVFIWGEDIA